LQIIYRKTFDKLKEHNKAFAAERKKPRPLKSDVLGGYAAENRGADFVQHLVLSPCARTRHWTRLRCSRVSAAISILNQNNKR
jgi:hypothetical protein